MTASNTPIVVTYRYPTRPGVAPAAYIDACRKMQDLLAATPGFQYRCLAQTDTGFFETVFWDSAKAADAAMDPIMKAMAGTPWMEMIDMENTTIERHPVVQAGGADPAKAANAA